MAIFFKTTINENTAFEMIERNLSGTSNDDGYMNIVEEEDERTISWSPGMLAEEFKDHVIEALRLTWIKARFWVVYERRDDRRDAETNDIRNAAVRLTRNYTGTVVVTLALLGRDHDTNDLELVFVCFQEDQHRRNFRVRYEGKFIPD